VGVAAVLSAVASVAAGESVLVALLEAVVPSVLAVVALAVVDVALVAWLVVRAVRLAERPRSDRLASVAAVAERYVPGLSALGLAAALEPTAADRRAALTDRYARGELTEAEFEREMAALLAEERERGDSAAPGATADRSGRGDTPASERAVEGERN